MNKTSEFKLLIKPWLQSFGILNFTNLENYSN